jgi:predicted lipoprotein with Yx(FWY)xxD motif
VLRAFTFLIAALVVAGCARMDGSGIPARFDGGRLVDVAGISLYTYDRDRPGADQRGCVDACEKRWSAFTAAPQARGRGLYRIVTWPDGVRQWTYYGKPLYRFEADRVAGDTAGEGFQNLWRLARR